MGTSKFIFHIEAEQEFTILIRIIATFNRRRIPIKELSSTIRYEERKLHIMVIIQDTKEGAMKISKKLDNEIDIIGVNLFEQLN